MTILRLLPGALCALASTHRRSFRIGLRTQLHLTHLLGSPMAQLGAVLSPRGREIAILRPVKIGPGV